jgi:ribosomal protein S7
MRKGAKYKSIYSLIVEDKEFYFFLKKFFGSFIFRGNKSRAVKMIDEIIFRMKKAIRKDPVHIFHRIFKKLVPVFSITYKRVGNRYQPIPKFASKNIRVVLMIS